MTRFPLLEPLVELPPPRRRERATAAVDDIAAASRNRGRELGSFFEAFVGNPGGRRLLEAVLGNSPFLAHSLVRGPQWLRANAEQGPERTLAGIVASVEAAWRGSADTGALMRSLRQARGAAAVTIALADLAGRWDLERVTRGLSDFADAAVSTVVRQQLLQASKGLVPPDSPDPAAGCGYFVLAMGKLGARELNYSSDVDLLPLWDGERVPPTDGRSHSGAFVRLTRELVRILEERTSDGSVVRTDLRLRPDSGASQIAISTQAAEAYYESVGQNWERAALIKARPVAGDLEAGSRFLDRLTPFLWRRHLDFAAIEDIHSIKRQIQTHKGHGSVRVRGHDIKLGAGGIREIEFFAQTQQLVAGGRDPSLRAPDTCGALKALAAAGRITEAAAEEMIEAYRFLRTLEHRLQMVDDRQTHIVPAGDEAFVGIAALCGFADEKAFDVAVRERLDRVAAHYQRLFGGAAPLSRAGNLVFTGGEDDPATLETLRRLGFAAPTNVAATVRSWHHGRHRATRTARARGLLTELMPALLEAFGRTTNPDGAFAYFDAFLARLPTGVQLFSLLNAHAELLGLVAEIMGTAPRLAENLSRTPALLDSVPLAGGGGAPSDRAEIAQDLHDALARARDFQDTLDSCRRWAREQRFHVGLRVMRGLGARESGYRLTDIAEELIRALVPSVESEFARRFGNIEGGSFAVVALGKLGAREMTSGSDLDLVFLYDSPSLESVSTGQRPLPATAYFARLSQRLLAALAAKTAEGPLFQVDLRLRPSGTSGPVATSLAGFRRYHRERSWTWEKMALTRARVVAGPPAFAARIADTLRAALAAPRDPDRLLLDVAEMRARIDREKPGAGIWRVKYVRGGLVDLEFLAQYLLLREAEARPGLLTGDTAEAFDRLRGAGVLPGGLSLRLREATLRIRGVQAFLRECHVEDLDERHAPAALKDALARVAGAESFSALRAVLAATEADVYQTFRDRIEAPAAALTAAGVSTEG